jgi:hypothetical protein
MPSQPERESAQSEAGSVKGPATAAAAEQPEDAKQPAGTSKEASHAAEQPKAAAATSSETQAPASGAGVVLVEMKDLAAGETKSSAEDKTQGTPASEGSSEAKPAAAEANATTSEANANAQASTASADSTGGTTPTEPTQSNDATAEAAAAQHARAAHQPAHDWFDRAYSYSGLACLAAGLLVGILALTSNASRFDALGNPKVVAGVLALFGALLFGMGRVRRILRGVERTVTTVRKQTDRLDEVVRDGNELRRDVVEVSGAASELKADVAAVQSYLEDLTRIVANPEIQVSMFHLAASQDKIAKRLDLALNERFRSVHAEIAKMVEAVSRAQRELQGTVESLEKRAAEQFGSQSARLERALEPVVAASSEQSARIDRLQERLKESAHELMLGHETVAEGLARTNEAGERNARAVAASVDKVREQLDSKLQAQSKAVDSRLERVCADLEQRFGRVESEQARNLRESAEGLRAELGEHAKSIHESIDAVGVGLGREHAGFASDLQALAPRFEQRMGRIESEQNRGLRELAKALKSELEEHAKALRESFDAATQVLGRSQESVATELQALAPRLEQRMRDESGNLLVDLQTLAQAGQAAVKEGLNELRSNAQVAQRELAAGIARVAPQVETHVGEQADRVAAEVRESARGARQDLNEVREELELALQSGWSGIEEQSKRSTQSVASEASRLAGKLDELSGAQAALLRESLQAASHVDGELAAIGQRLAQGIQRVDDSQAAMLSEITGRLAADRMRAERALQDGLRAFESSALRSQQELSKGFGEVAPLVAAELQVQVEALHSAIENSRGVSESTSEHLRNELQALAKRIETLLSADPQLEGSVVAIASKTESAPAPAASYAERADRPEPTTRIDPASEPPAALPRASQGRQVDARSGEQAAFGAWVDGTARSERPAPSFGAPGPQRSSDSDADPEC